jgi:dTDP-4-amino-4,6-dideoxygalactose transaminase
MANGIYRITEDFEKKLSEYTGAPYVVALDNQSNALFLSLYYENNVKKSIKNDTITIPNRTYPSVPCEIIHSGLKVKFSKDYDNLNEDRGTLKGSYNLYPTNIWDSALSFTTNMYKPGTHMCKIGRAHV